MPAGFSRSESQRNKVWRYPSCVLCSTRQTTTTSSSLQTAHTRSATLRNARSTAVAPPSLAQTMSHHVPVPEIHKRQRDDETEALIREALEEEQQRKKAKKGGGVAGVAGASSVLLKLGVGGSACVVYAVVSSLSAHTAEQHLRTTRTAGVGHRIAPTGRMSRHTSYQKNKTMPTDQTVTLHVNPSAPPPPSITPFLHTHTHTRTPFSLLSPPPAPTTNHQQNSPSSSCRCRRQERQAQQGQDPP